MKFTREYYKIRFPANTGNYDEWHSSRNGTDQWDSVQQVKSILTRGIRGGYKGKLRREFENYEIVKFTEHVEIEEEVVVI